MKIPHYIHRKSWQPGDRVKVAVGKYKGQKGVITGRAERHNYLVLLDGEKRPRQLNKGVLDKDK